MVTWTLLFMKQHIASALCSEVLALLTPLISTNQQAPSIAAIQAPIGYQGLSKIFQILSLQSLILNPAVFPLL